MSTKKENRELETLRGGWKNTKDNKDLAYYLSKDYPFVVYPAEEGGFVAEIEELPGCITQGESLEEVSQRIDDARRAWIETAYEDSLEIPQPRTEEEYSGRFVIRLPKYLHRRLSEQASREEVSLNQYVLSILSGSITTSYRDNEQIANLLQDIRRLLEEPRKQVGILTSGYDLSAWHMSITSLVNKPIPVPDNREKELVAL